jgi:hypothetical protein
MKVACWYNECVTALFADGAGERQAARVLDHIARARDQGQAVILITHNFSTHFRGGRSDGARARARCGTLPPR